MGRGERREQRPFADPTRELVFFVFSQGNLLIYGTETVHEYPTTRCAPTTRCIAIAKVKGPKNNVGVGIIVPVMIVGDIERERMLVRVDSIVWGGIASVAWADPISPNH